MSSPDKPPPNQPPNLTAKQVPWGGARKPPAPPPPPAEPPAPPAPEEPKAAALTAKQIPWGRAREAPKSPPPPAEPAPVAPPPAEAPALTAKKIPWGGARKDPAPLAPVPEAKPAALTAKQVPWGGAAKTAAPPPPAPPPEADDTAVTAAPVATWALPKSGSAAAEAPPAETPPPESGAEDELTAEQIVAQLTRAPFRKGKKTKPSTQRPEGPGVGVYRARPISFEATRWDAVKLWSRAHWWQLSFGGVALCAALVSLYLARLASLNATVDQEWHDVEILLNQRYALAPAYLQCLASFSSEERFTVTLAERSLAAWRGAHTEPEVAAAAMRMEHALTQLSRVMSRYARNTVATDADEAAGAARFSQLEEQRERSRLALSAKVPAYNQHVEHFNAKVEGIPGAWLAWLVGLHARAPLYTNGSTRN